LKYEVRRTKDENLDSDLIIYIFYHRISNLTRGKKVDKTTALLLNTHQRRTKKMNILKSVVSLLFVKPFLFFLSLLAEKCPECGGMIEYAQNSPHDREIKFCRDCGWKNYDSATD
jgi:hypothetical protein